MAQGGKGGSHRLLSYLNEAGSKGDGPWGKMGMEMRFVRE
jgi:hypothetical protein